MNEPTPVPLLLELQGHAASSDATQSIAVEPTGILRISGVASGDSVAEVNFGKYSLMVPLVMDMGPVQTLRALEQALPAGFLLRVVHEQAGILQVALLRRSDSQRLQPVPAPSHLPAALPPPLPTAAQLAVPMRVVAAVTCDDPEQHIAVEPSGLIRIAGVSSRAGLSPSVMRVSLEARLLELELPRGATPRESFERLCEAAHKRLPPGVRLLLVNSGEGPGGDVVFDVLKPAPPPSRGFGV